MFFSRMILFSCENEYRVILKIPEELLLEETTGQDGILKKGQFKRGNILIPYVDYKFKRDSLKEITLNPYVKEKEVYLNWESENYYGRIKFIMYRFIVQQFQ